MTTVWQWLVAGLALVAVGEELPPLTPAELAAKVQATEARVAVLEITEVEELHRMKPAGPAVFDDADPRARAGDVVKTTTTRATIQEPLSRGRYRVTRRAAAEHGTDEGTRITVYDGLLVTEWQQGQRSAQVGTVRGGDPTFASRSANLPGTYPFVGIGGHTLGEHLGAHVDDMRILPPETVAGVQTYVALTPQRAFSATGDGPYLKLWLAPATGYMPVRLETGNLVGAWAQPFAVTVWSDFREVADGLWYPFAVWRYGEGEFVLHGVADTVTVPTTVPASTFTLELPPGTRVHDWRTDTEYVVRAPLLQRLLLPVAAGVVVVLVLAALVRRRRRRRAA